MPGSENLWGGKGLDARRCLALAGVFAVTKTWDAHSRVP